MIYIFVGHAVRAFNNSKNEIAESNYFLFSLVKYFFKTISSSSPVVDRLYPILYTSNFLQAQILVRLEIIGQLPLPEGRGLRK
jgi:hypothetical protein